MVSGDGKLRGSSQGDIVGGDKGIILSIVGGTGSGDTSCDSVNEITGEVDGEVLRCGEVGSWVEVECSPVESVACGDSVIVDAVEVQFPGESEGTGGGIGGDGNVLHLHGGVLIASVDDGDGSGECEVDIGSDDEIDAIERECEGIEVGIGECSDIPLVSGDGKLGGSSQGDITGGEE